MKYHFTKVYIQRKCYIFLWIINRRKLHPPRTAFLLAKGLSFLWITSTYLALPLSFEHSYLHKRLSRWKWHQCKCISQPDLHFSCFYSFSSFLSFFPDFSKIIQTYFLLGSFIPVFDIPHVSGSACHSLEASILYMAPTFQFRALYMTCHFLLEYNSSTMLWQRKQSNSVFHLYQSQILPFHIHLTVSIRQTSLFIYFSFPFSAWMHYQAVSSSSQPLHQFQLTNIQQACLGPLWTLHSSNLFL